MIDISADLESAANGAGDWSHEKFKSLLRAFAAEFPFADLDWDEDVPEGWARFIFHNGDVLAVLLILRVDWPLSFVIGHGQKQMESIEFLWKNGIVATLVSGWDNVCLTCDPPALAAAFSAWNCLQLGIPDPEGFSLSDFWWATAN